MRRRNLFESIMLALFIMCITFAMSATLEYSTRASEREYLRQGTWLVAMVFAVVAVYGASRVLGKNENRIPKPAKDIAEAFFVLAAMGVGLYLRLKVIHGIPVEPASDFETYYRLSIHLYNDTLLSPEGDVYRQYVAKFPHTIGFPMFVLVPAYKLAGGISLMAGLYANLVFSMGSILLLYLIGRKCCGRLGGIICAVLLALWPSHIFFANMLATEPSFMFFILVAALLMTYILDRKQDCLWNRHPGVVVLMMFLLGVVLGFSAAIRPMAAILLAAYVVAMLCVPQVKGRITKSAGEQILTHKWLCIIIVGLMYVLATNITTQAVRDVIQEEPATGITASGYNFMVGLNVQHKGVWNQDDADFFGDQYDETGSASEAHKAALQVGVQRLQSSPLDVLDLIVYKFRDLWQTDDFGIDWNLLWTEQQHTLTPELKATLESYRYPGRYMYMGVLLFVAVGAIAEWRRRRTLDAMRLACILFFMGTALSHMLLETQVRYHYNMIPFLILMASMPISDWLTEMKNEPPEKVVVEYVRIEPQDVSNIRFDMNTALREGHIKISATQASVDVRVEEDAAAQTDETDGWPPDGVPENGAPEDGASGETAEGTPSGDAGDVPADGAEDALADELQPDDAPSKDAMPDQAALHRSKQNPKRKVSNVWNRR